MGWPRRIRCSIKVVHSITTGGRAGLLMTRCPLDTPCQLTVCPCYLSDSGVMLFLVLGFYLAGFVLYDLGLLQVKGVTISEVS